MVVGVGNRLEDLVICHNCKKILEKCAYCGAWVLNVADIWVDAERDWLPVKYDDKIWLQLAKQHNLDCNWIDTRGRQKSAG